MDQDLFHFINQAIHHPFLDFAMPLITSKGYFLTLIIAVLFSLKDPKKGLLAIIMSLIALSVGDASSNILKHLIERPRPCQELEGLRLLVGCGGSFSMPSSHAVNAFAVATAFSFFFRGAAVPMLLIASLVAYSRIYVGVHYPSDVIAGAVWGSLTAGVVLFLFTWSSERFRKNPYSTALFLSLITLTAFRYYYIVTGPLDLSPDEANYWVWSRRLDLSYYSKGPMIAYLIAASTRLMGDSVLGVRALAPLFLALSSLIMYRLTRELLQNDKHVEIKASLAAYLPHTTPLFVSTGLIMTVDSPFIFFWTLSLLLFWKAVYPPGNGRTEPASGHSASPAFRNVTVPWILLGLSIGFGLLTKYSMGGFYLCALLFLLSSRDVRGLLTKKGPYLSVIISLAVFSPVIIWNMNHDWLTLKHTAGHAHLSEGLNISLKYFFNFLGSQLGVLTPVLFMIIVYGAVRHYLSGPGAPYRRFLFWFWAPVLGFFILKSLQGKVQANWAMSTYITAFIASTDYLFSSRPLKTWRRATLTAALIVAIYVTTVVHYLPVFDVPIKMDPTSRSRGWEELGQRADEIFREMTSSGDAEVFIFSDRYQVASAVAFYMQDQPDTYCIPLGRRMNQYDVWGGFDDLVGQDAVFVRQGNEYFPEELIDSFDRYERERFVVTENEKILRIYTIFRCFGFRGFEPKAFKKF